MGPLPRLFSDFHSPSCQCGLLPSPPQQVTLPVFRGNRSHSRKCPPLILLSPLSPLSLYHTGINVRTSQCPSLSFKDQMCAMSCWNFLFLHFDPHVPCPTPAAFCLRCNYLFKAPGHRVNTNTLALPVCLINRSHRPPLPKASSSRT